MKANFWVRLGLAAFSVAALLMPNVASAGWGKYRSVTSYSSPTVPSITYRERVTYRPAAPVVVASPVVPAVAYVPAGGYAPAVNAYMPATYVPHVTGYAPAPMVYPVAGMTTQYTIGRPGAVRATYYAPVVPAYAPVVQPTYVQPFLFTP